MNLFEGYLCINLYSSQCSLTDTLYGKNKRGGSHVYVPVLRHLSYCFVGLTNHFTEFIVNSLHIPTELLNVWIFIQRTRERKGHPSRLNLSNWRLDRLVQVDVESVTTRYTLSDLNARLPAEPDITEGEIRSAVRAFPVAGRTQQFRGKFLAGFMRRFLSKLRTDLVADTPRYFSARRSVPLQLSRSNFLSDLCQHADTPTCLRAFLQDLKQSRPPSQ